MIVEFGPSKYTSERGGWFFSCDTGDGVLLGIQHPGEWSCPVLGLHRHVVTEEQLLELDRHSTLIQGDPEMGAALYTVPAEVWARVMGYEWEREEGDIIAYLFTDSEYIIRLHFGFE